MANTKLYAFNYTNAELPFELKVRYSKGIDKFPKKHKVFVRNAPAA